MRKVVVSNTKSINNSSVAQTKHHRKTRLPASKLSKAIKSQLKKRSRCLSVLCNTNISIGNTPKLDDAVTNLTK